MEILTLDVPTLLVAARVVGLNVTSAEGKISVRGPKGAGPLVRLLLAHKADVLVALEKEGVVAGTLASTPNPPVPPGHGWRRPIAYWPIEWRQRWADRAEGYQEAGEPWDVAEWQAFLGIKAKINEAVSAGENVEFIEPPAGLSDRDALAQMAEIDWSTGSLADLIESGRQWNTNARTAK
jgi:hypothetical protein